MKRKLSKCQAVVMGKTQCKQLLCSKNVDIQICYWSRTTELKSDKQIANVCTNLTGCSAEAFAEHAI